jgi:hypothetical protein
MQILEDLIRRPPVDVATWALDQVQALKQPGANVEQMPVFKLAGALQAAPKEKKQALVHSTMAGFGDLPASRRVEAVRLAMQSQDIMQKADNMEVQRMAQQQHASAMQRLRALEERQAAAQGQAPPPLEQGYNDQFEMQQDPLVENLLKITQEARFNEMPPEELQGMAQVAQRDAHSLVQPQQLLDVVAQLEPGEREQLTEALVEAKVVPEEQRGVLEEAVRPGGYADKLAGVLSLAAKAQTYAWVFVALPIAEFILAMVFDHFECSTPLVAWLRFDALLALGVSVVAYITGHTLTPVYQKLNEDPVGAVQRWQTVADARSWKVRLETAVPGIPFDTYRIGAAGLAAMVVLVLIGAVWAVIGVLELLATMFAGCNVATTFFCIIFIGMRFACVVALLWGLYYILDEIQRHRSRAPMLGGSSLLPMSEDAYPRTNQHGGQYNQGYPQQGYQQQGQQHGNQGYNYQQAPTNPQYGNYGPRHS